MAKFKYILILFVIGSFLFGCKTQQSSLQSENETALTTWEPTEKALLWTITKKGYKASYLFGTIHLISEENYFLPRLTKESIAVCDKIVFEINMDEMTDLSAQMGILSKAFMNDGMRLSDLLSDQDYELVSDHFADLGLPMMMLERIKPMFLTVLVGEDMDPGMLQNGSMLSYEIELDKLASVKGLEKGGLETIDYQVSLFDKIPYSDQAEMLVETIRYSDEEAESSLDLYAEMYRTQDLKKMHDFTLAEESGMMKYSDILLYDRNANWIPLMEEMMKTDPVFFAVGAGHLGGTKGVLALLRKRGFDVQPVL